MAVAQLLRQMKILLPRDGAEGVSVFFEMILKKMFGAKSLSTAEGRRQEGREG